MQGNRNGSIGTEHEARRMWEDMQHERESVICSACETIRQHAESTFECIVHIVAALTDKTEEEIFSAAKSTDVLHARWLCWYATRIATDATYREIGEQSAKFGYPCKPNTIGHAISKMAEVIEGGGRWKRYWTILQRLIAEDTTTASDEAQKYKIVINVPEALSGRVKIETA